MDVTTSTKSYSYSVTLPRENHLGIYAPRQYWAKQQCFCRITVVHVLVVLGVHGSTVTTQLDQSV